MLGVVLGLWAALGCASAGAREGGEEGTLAPGSRAEPEPQRERKPLSEKVAGRAAEGAIDEALETLDRPENRERLSRILASEPMQAAAREITAQIDPLAWTALRALLAVVALAVVMVVLRRAWPRGGALWARLALLGALGVALNQLLGSSVARAAADPQAAKQAHAPAKAKNVNGSWNATLWSYGPLNPPGRSGSAPITWS